jgi:SAM-dependent methyltransferase
LKFNSSQDGTNDSFRPFYPNASKVIRKFQSAQIINLGSGNTFTFENYISHNSVASSFVAVDLIEFKVDFYFLDIKKVTFDVCDLDLLLLPFLSNKKFNVVCIFEVLEHVDNIDELLQNAYSFMDDDSRLLVSFPNLSSLLSRFSILLGFQPHILEASNKFPTSGMGILGGLNYKGGPSIHHIRGLTYRAVKALLQSHGFEIVDKRGFSFFPLWPQRGLVALSQQIYIEVKKFT